MSNSLLSYALEKAVNNHGFEILKSPQLANILSDYGAFEAHDIEKAVKKEVISELVADKYGEKLIRWKRKKTKNNWENENKKFIGNFIRKHSFDDTVVGDISKEFISVVGLTPVFKPQKTRGSWTKLVFGESIKLQKGDKFAILLGSIMELIILLFSLLGDVNDGSSAIAGLIFIVIHLFMWLLICQSGNPTAKKNPGTSITWAFLIGELITALFSILIAASDINISAFIAYFIASTLVLFLMARISETNHGRLFWVTSIILSLILLIVFSIPLLVKQGMIHSHKKACLESIELLEKHKQQYIELGFMGVHLGDSFSDVLQKMKNDTNVVRQLPIKKESSFVSFDVFDKETFQKEYRLLSPDCGIEMDRELQYDVSFDNDTIRLYILFKSDTVKYIGFNSNKCDLYIQKYGDPEIYYTKEPEEYISKCRHFPYFEKTTEEINERPYYPRDLKDKLIADYCPIKQWTFSNGVIRISMFSTEYINNDLFDLLTLKIKQEKERKEIERQEQERLERESQLKLEQLEKEEAIRKEQEKKRIEEVHNNAVKQI